MPTGIAQLDPDVVRSLLCDRRHAHDRGICFEIAEAELDDLYDEIQLREAAGNPLSSDEIDDRKDHIEVELDQCMEKANKAYETCMTRYLRRPPEADQPQTTPPPNP
jgi:hypothetical protein